MRVPSPNEPLSRHTDAIADLATGATNAAGSFDLAAGATVTDVANDLCTGNSVIHMSPRTAAAANIGWWIASTRNGGFTVGHPSAATGCTFDYEIRRR